MSLILGLSLNAWINLNFFLAALLIICSCAVIVLLVVLKTRQVSILIINVIAVIIGFSLGSLQKYDVGNVSVPGGDLNKGVVVVCDARLIDDPVIGEHNARFDVGLKSCRLPENEVFERARGKARIYAYGGMADVHAGDMVRFRAKLKTARDFRNPGAFSWKRFLLSRGIGAVGTLNDPAWMIKLPVSSEVIGLNEGLHRFREKLDFAIKSSTSKEASGVIRAVLAGQKYAVDDDVREDFQKAGIAHLLAISGLHVGYVALFVYLLLWFLVGRWTKLILRVPLQKVAAAITLPLVWGFILSVGAPVSAVRAGIMVSVYLIGMMAGWRRDLLTTLAVAALIIVCLEPLAVFDVSFQLSFVSVLAILLISPRIMEFFRDWFSDRREWYWRLTYKFLQLISVTIAATIGSAPLVAYHFYMTTGVGFVSNLFAVPWAGAVILPLAAVASILTFVWPIAAKFVLWPLAGKATEVLIAVAQNLAHWGDALVFRAAPSGADTVLVYAAIAVVVFWKRLFYRRWIAGAVAMGLVFNVGWWYMKPVMTNELEVTFFDVGQGDSALVRFPGGKTMLIDGGGLPGGEFDIGENVLFPAILKKGIRKLDIMVLSHPHHDHYRGLATMAERFHPQELWISGASPPEQERELWDTFLRRVESAGVKFKKKNNSSDPMDIGRVKIELLYPDGELPRDIDANDTSMVLKISYGEISFLFTGDLMELGERSLMSNGSDLRSTVLKVAHHGSETSSSEEFLQAVKPRIAVISLGQYNRYGMPDQTVIDRLKVAGTKIYRTDLNGAITIRTDGNEVSADMVVH